MKAEEIYILVGCEESQAIANALRTRGFNAYSCDLEPCSGGHPEYHIQGDVFKAIASKCFKTQDGKYHQITHWHAGIFHPVCKYLANSGSRWLYNADKTFNHPRWAKLGEAMLFFNNIRKACMISGIEYFTLENPIPHKHAVNGISGVDGIGKHSQLIQPYQFGHLEKKATCLWLTRFDQLHHTNNVYKEMMKLEYKERAKVHYASPGPEREKIRSKTYSGIAEAIAEQWGNQLINEL